MATQPGRHTRPSFVWGGVWENAGEGLQVTVPLRVKPCPPHEDTETQRHGTCPDHPHPGGLEAKQGAPEASGVLCHQPF